MRAQPPASSHSIPEHSAYPAGDSLRCGTTCLLAQHHDAGDAGCWRAGERCLCTQQGLPTARPQLLTLATRLGRTVPAAPLQTGLPRVLQLCYCPQPPQLLALPGVPDVPAVQPGPPAGRRCWASMLGSCQTPTQHQQPVVLCWLACNCCLHFLLLLLLQLLRNLPNAAPCCCQLLHCPLPLSALPYHPLPSVTTRAGPHQPLPQPAPLPHLQRF